MLLLLEYTIRGVMLGATYGLLALPISLTLKTSRTIDFALGSYAVVAAAIATMIGGTAGVLLGIGAAAICSALMAAIYVHLRREEGEHDMIVTALASFGVAVAIGSTILAVWGSQPFAKPGYMDALLLGPIRINTQGLINLAVASVVLAMTTLLLYRTNLGTALQACAINADGARLAGIPVLAVQASVFVVGGALSGISGILILHGAGLDFTSGLSLTLSGFAAAIIFGSNSPARCFIGGIAIGVVEALSSGYASGAVTALVPQVAVLIALSIGLYRKANFNGDRP